MDSNDATFSCRRTRSREGEVQIHLRRPGPHLHRTGWLDQPSRLPNIRRRIIWPYTRTSMRTIRSQFDSQHRSSDARRHFCYRNQCIINTFRVQHILFFLFVNNFHVALSAFIHEATTEPRLHHFKSIA